MKYRWDVWIATVRYEDIPQISKIRPVVILDSNAIFTLSLKGTSHESREGYPGEYRLKYWKEAGLEKETVIRCSQPIQLHERDFKRRIGTLHPADIFNIKMILKDMPWCSQSSI